MKPLVPRTDYDAHLAYPSATEAHPELAAAAIGRRGFLRTAALAGGALAGALALGRWAEGATPARSVTLLTGRRYTFRYGNHRLEKVVVQTANPQLSTWLESADGRKAVELELVRTLDAHSCVDLADGKRLAALQNALALTVVRAYRMGTRRATPNPTAVLFVGVPYDDCEGRCARPVPYCRPPRP